MDVTKKPGNVLKLQPIMGRVLVATGPCIAGAVYFFGWRSLAMVVWAAAVGFIVELIFTRSRGEPVTESVFVTTTLLALIMPPTIPWHVLTVGTVFALLFAKEVFGGFGHNVFNPAMVGRCFVYVCFPVALTGTWAPAASGAWGALNRWTTVSSENAVTSATPTAHLKAGKLVAVARPGPNVSKVIPFQIREGEQVNVGKATLYWALLVGRISGTTGVTSALLILIGGLYLLYTKTADRRIIASLIISYAIFNQALYWFKVKPVQDALIAMLSGGFLFGAFFMATDPVSSPRTTEAKIIYGVVIAVFATIIRNFSIFNGGLMFAILIGNMFAPILDYAVRSYKTSRPRTAAQ
jgi:RnfABCDGE-type electron transport complex D subunit